MQLRVLRVNSFFAPATYRYFAANEIETPLARLVLQGKVHDGETVLVDADAARASLTFTPRPTAP